MIEWKGSANYARGRLGLHPTCVVLHTMAGTLEGSDSWFNNPSAQVSAHYGVALEAGTPAHQYVNLHDTAWANGILEAGHRWPGNRNAPNSDSVSIETEDHRDPRAAVTDWQYEQTRALIEQQIMPAYPSIVYLVGHRAVSPRSRANCPGARWIESGRFAQLAKDTGLAPVV